MSPFARNLKKALICICILFILFANGRKLFRPVGKREQETLNKQQRNAECCAKNMRCCKKPPAPQVEIRAILARCPNVGHVQSGTISRIMNKPVLNANEIGLKSFQGFDEDEPLVQSRVVNCLRKVLMTLKIHHSGPVSCNNQYVVVDHVYDPITEKTVRLLNPYVVKFREEQVSKAFHLKFIDYVNSEATEKVYNKHDGNYTGCYVDRFRSTCGLVKFNGEVVPYSEGFCCSCDAKVNNQRQPNSMNEKMEEIVAASDPAYLMDKVACPRDFYDHTQMNSSANTENHAPVPRRSLPQPSGRWKYTTYHSSGSTQKPKVTSSKSYLKTKRSDDEVASFYDPPPQYLEKLLAQKNRRKDQRNYIEEVRKSHSPLGVSLREFIDDELSNQEYLGKQESLKDRESLDNHEPLENPLLRKIRQTFPSGVQKRGGQNCADRYTPSGQDPDHFHESTHCLRFSDVWYGVYKLGASSIEQTVEVTIYERYESESGVSAWRQITNGSVRLNNRQPLHEDALPTISLQFSSKILTDPDKYAHLNGRRILIPEGIKDCDIHEYPEMSGGPAEYLVVKPERIAMEGDQCDRIGVGFEAFFKQPERCGMPRGTCLHAQPKHLWRYDKRLERKNQKGCYFLKYYTNLTNNPIITNTTTGEKFLMVAYNGAQLSTIDIEIKADFNTVVREIATAAITEVYVDATCMKVAFLTIKVINTGLISSRFYVQLSDFPLEVPEYFNQIRSKTAVIAPQTLHVYTLEIRAPLPADLMFCSVEVLNDKKELVALRRVRIQKLDRCICTWYCLCACVASSEGLTCNPMSLEHYHAAGFEGALPIVTYMIHYTLLDDLLSVVVYFVVFLLGILLVMGLCKGLMGLCCFGVGMWGLPVILDLPKRMNKYYEKKLRRFDVIYDDHGWPVSPLTYEPVQNISKSTEFCANLVFFFTYPAACSMIILKRLCCPYYTKLNPSIASKYNDDKDTCVKCCRSPGHYNKKKREDRDSDKTKMKQRGKKNEHRSNKQMESDKQKADREKADKQRADKQKADQEKADEQRAIQQKAEKQKADQQKHAHKKPVTTKPKKVKSKSKKSQVKIIKPSSHISSTSSNGPPSTNPVTAFSLTSPKIRSKSEKGPISTKHSEAEQMSDANTSISSDLTTLTTSAAQTESDLMPSPLSLGEPPKSKPSKSKLSNPTAAKSEKLKKKSSIKRSKSKSSQTSSSRTGKFCRLGRKSRSSKSKGDESKASKAERKKLEREATPQKTSTLRSLASQKPPDVRQTLEHVSIFKKVSISKRPIASTPSRESYDSLNELNKHDSDEIPSKASHDILSTSTSVDFDREISGDKDTTFTITCTTPTKTTMTDTSSQSSLMYLSKHDSSIMSAISDTESELPRKQEKKKRVSKLGKVKEAKSKASSLLSRPKSL